MKTKAEKRAIRAEKRRRREMDNGPTRFREKRPFITDPKTDAFLQSYEWRKVRMEVLKDQGRRCKCCGRTPDDGVKIHVDHIKPRKLFPQLALSHSNLQVLCEDCNHGKGNWDQTDWRESSEPQWDEELAAAFSRWMK